MPVKLFKLGVFTPVSNMFTTLEDGTNEDNLESSHRQIERSKELVKS